MKIFIRLLGRCCTFSGTSVRYSSSYAIPFLGQMFSGIEEIKVLGEYIFVFGLHCLSVISNTRDTLGTLFDLIHPVPCISVGTKNY